jgi:hypothetical protein
LDSVVALHVTVTALPVVEEVGVEPWFIDVTADAPLPPGAEVTAQYAHATPAGAMTARVKATSSLRVLVMIPRPGRR